MDSLIHLNVGGKLFTTAKSTLLNSSGNSSFFHGILEGQFKWATDNNGAYFIDRDGNYFEIILNYLRTGQLFVPSSLSIDLLYTEADFYGISSLLSLIESKQTDSCGGQLFFATIPSKHEYQNNILHIVAAGNSVAVLYESGRIMSFVNKEGIWSVEFTCDDFLQLSPKSESSLDANNLNKEEPFVVEQMSLYASASHPKRWFLAVYSMKKVHLYTREKKIGDVDILINSLDCLLFIKRGQELVLVNEKESQIFLVGLTTLRPWNLENKLKKIACTVSDPEGAMWCASGPDVFILMVGYKENTCLQPIYSDPNGEEITVMRKAPGYVFYGTKEGSVNKVELDTKKNLAAIRAHIHPISDILFCANGDIISICDQDHVRVNDSQGNLLASYSLKTGTSFLSSYQNPFFVSFSQHKCELFDPISQKKLFTIYGLKKSPITTHSFNKLKDSQYLVTGHSDGSLQFWLLDRAKAPFSSPNSPVIQNVPVMYT